MGLPISKEEYEKINANMTAEETSPPPSNPDARRSQAEYVARFEAKLAGKEELRKASQEWLYEIDDHVLTELNLWLKSFRAETDEKLKLALYVDAMTFFDDLLSTVMRGKGHLQCGSTYTSEIEEMVERANEK